MVGVGDPGKQAQQAMRNVKQLLEEAGSKLAHICKITVYITDRAYREPVYREIGKWLKERLSLLDRPDRARPGAAEWVMEIDVEAVIPEGAAPRATTGPEWADIRLKKAKAGKRRRQTRAA